MDRKGSKALRECVCKEAKKRWGESRALDQTQVLLDRYEHVANKRDRLIHNVWAQSVEGVPEMLTKDPKEKRIPTVAELDALCAEFESVISQLHHARLKGFLHQALKDQASS